MVDDCKILIVGLGNPGYSGTVHNVGAYMVQKQIEDLKAVKKKEGYYKFELISNIYFAFNVSLMNSSGEKVQELLRKNRIKHLIVIYDDIRVKYGSYRVVFGGGDKGHNGIKSLEEKCCKLLHNGNFFRIRVGVGPKPKEIELSDYVLSKVQQENQILLLNLYGNLWLEVYKICKSIISDQA